MVSNEHNALAILVRCDEETLAQLLIRLDQTVGKAINEDIHTDESTPRSWPISSTRPVVST